ncbi:uncharacterized protein JCM10292_002434 [Rhodotorula paludigena]|uniref:uncharacterized protein n=1 Tax=Rhodotorula paludigena TaxID=86838 RepID=UPI00317F147C
MRHFGKPQCEPDWFISLSHTTAGVDANCIYEMRQRAQELREYILLYKYYYEYFDRMKPYSAHSLSHEAPMGLRATERYTGRQVYARSLTQY